MREEVGGRGADALHGPSSEEVGFPPGLVGSDTEMAEQEYHKKGEASSKDKTSDEEAEVRKNEMFRNRARQ